jgi:2-alkyl-3-oxoalkanoate reductase
MRVFIAGATGVLGKRVVKQLVEGGHTVAAASRSAANREALTKMGAEPRDCDVLDAAQTTRAAEGAGAVLHLATKIPGKQRTTMKDWADNDRLRRDGTRALLAAATAHGARYVQQSVAWIYGDRGEEWVDEGAPLPDVASLAGTIRSSIDMEDQVRAAARGGVPTVILRGGAFYAADSGHTRMMIQRTRQGLMRVPGNGRQFLSLIHIDDMAAAVVAATVAEEVPADAVYNVVDDEPVRMGALFAFLADRLGRKRPGSVPRWLARLVMGKPVTETLYLSVRVSNARTKEGLGWAPRFPTYREGFDQVMRELTA